MFTSGPFTKLEKEKSVDDSPKKEITKIKPIGNPSSFFSTGPFGNEKDPTTTTEIEDEQDV